MYVVRFVRNDLQPCEEYYYPKIEEARYHLSLFEGDDSGLYKKIELVNYESEQLIEVLHYA